MAGAGSTQWTTGSCRILNSPGLVRMARSAHGEPVVPMGASDMHVPRNAVEIEREEVAS